jgi:peptide/nickel transport system permease protein
MPGSTRGSATTDRLGGPSWLARLGRGHLAKAGLVAIAALVGAAALAPWLAPADPTEQALERMLEPPGRAHLLGTDDLGRDVFARMLQGSFVSLSIGFVAVSIELAIGVLLGGLAGFYGGRVDTLIMRFTDVMLCFPTFFLILTVVALLPPSIWNVMIVIGVTSWMGTCRFVRAELMSLREQDFVRAAKALGLSDARIIFRHMVPNAIAPVLVSATIAVASAILTESALSYLGFGVQPPNASWGNILADGRVFLFDAPWLFAIPGVAILVVVLAFNLVGEGLRDALNPRLRRGR